MHSHAGTAGQYGNCSRHDNTFHFNSPDTNCRELNGSFSIYTPDLASPAAVSIEFAGIDMDHDTCKAALSYAPAPLDFANASARVGFILYSNALSWKWRIRAYQVLLKKKSSRVPGAWC